MLRTLLPLSKRFDGVILNHRVNFTERTNHRVNFTEGTWKYSITKHSADNVPGLLRVRVETEAA